MRARQRGADGAVAADRSAALVSYVQLDEPGIPAVQVCGAALTGIGLAIAPRRALTSAVILIEALTWPQRPLQLMMN